MSAHTPLLLRLILIRKDASVILAWTPNCGIGRRGEGAALQEGYRCGFSREHAIAARGTAFLLMRRRPFALRR